LAAVSSAPTPVIQRRAAYTFLALAWLVAVNLRTVLLAVPPVLPQIRQDLGLSYTATGFLTSLPVLVMGLAAVPGAFLVARVGARSAISVGLALLAAGALLRALVPAALPIFTFTALLSLGIAVTESAMPVLVRQWFPRQIGLGTAIYSNGLMIGETLAASLTLSLLTLFHTRDWRVTFIFWGMLVAAALALWLAFAPRERWEGTAQRLSGWKAGWNTWRGWCIGLLMGSSSLIYYGMNTWIPNYDKALGRTDAIPAELGILNSLAIPISLLIIAFAHKLAGRRWPVIFSGLLCLIGIFGWLFAPVSTALLWVGVLGVGQGGIFLLGLALPPLLAPEHEVAGYMGLALTLNALCAFCGSLIGGGLWDLSGIPALAFLPVILASGIPILLGAVLLRPAREAA
jgi:CP family cyanate transporter-like MFS transporter